MRVEIPECKKCCCCVPLRRGVLAFAYINLAFSLLCIGVELFIEIDKSEYTMMTFHGNGFVTKPWLALLLYSLDVCFQIILLIGAHTKHIRLLTIYFYYGVTTALATFMTLLLMDIRLDRPFMFIVVDACCVFFAIVLHIYQLCLVWNLIKKLRKNSGMTFVNHMSEVVVEPAEDRSRNPL